MPFTKQFCINILNDNYSDLEQLGLQRGLSWPDKDVLETLPKIVENLSKVIAPNGFQSWMIIKNNTLEIIGDLGFKGFNQTDNSIDLGYGIISEERQKGYATEAIEAIINWAFSTNVVQKITANCLIENIYSNRLLYKFNFIQIKTESKMNYWELCNINFIKK
jgi:[ribosomal protein S5]-alanine N-acetyltransferase